MPKRVIRYTSGLANAAIVALILYIVLLLALPTRVFVELLNGIFLGMVGAVTVVFFPLFWRSVRQKKFDRVAQLTIGIILTWFSLILSRSLNVLGKITGETVALASSPLVTLAAYLAIVGGVLHITAPGMMDDRLKYNKGLLAGALIVGAVIACFTIFAQRNGLSWL